MSKHFSFDDVDVYREDAALFGPGCWLNTNCIHFGLRLIEHESYFLDSGGKGAVLIFDPSQVSFVRFQLETEEEMDDFRKGNDVDNARWLFIPVNNCQSLFESGSHWSFMAYHVPSSTGIHLDSMRGNNNDVAREILGKLNQTVSIKLRKEPKFVSLPTSICPQQQDGCNCGVFTLLFADCLARAILTGNVDSTSDIVTEDTLVTGNLEAWASVLKDIDEKSPMVYREVIVEKMNSLW